MKVSNTKLGLIGMALILSGVSSQSIAQENATVNFSARLVAATCDISASQSKVDLGTFAIGKLTDKNDAPIAEKSFNLVLNNCTKPFADDTGVSVLSTGDTLTGHKNMFSSASATQVGIKLSSKYEGNSVELEPNTTVEVLKAKADQTEFIVPVTAGLYSTVAGNTVTAQDVNVPVTFSVAYN